jgi:hypothetical protein
MLAPDEFGRLAICEQLLPRGHSRAEVQRSGDVAGEAPVARDVRHAAPRDARMHRGHRAVTRRLR